MKIILKRAPYFLFAVFALFHVAIAQETALKTVQNKSLGYSISFPDSWIVSDFRTTSADNFVAVFHEGYRDFIALTVASEKYPAAGQTTADFVAFTLKHPETSLESLTNPVLISNQRVKWGSHEAVAVMVESTNPDIGSRDTTIFYYTMVNDVFYAISLFCQTSNFSRYKPTMEKAANSFTIFPVENGPRVRSSSDIINTEAISLPAPIYTNAARAVKAVGTVKVQIKVDTNGNVVSADIISGSPLLKTTVVEAAKKARFNPKSGIESGILIYTFPPN